MSAAPGAPAPPQIVRGADLLLVLIISLGSARLAAGVAAGVIGPDGLSGDDGHGVLAAVLLLLLIQTGIILGAIYVVIIRWRGLDWADLGLRPFARAWYVKAVLFAVLLLPAVALVNALIPRFAGQPFENPQIYAIAPAGFSWLGLVTMTVMAGIVAPFAEELAFRGLLFPWLRARLGLPVSALLSALCFAFLHGVVLLVPALTMVGIALALIYVRSGSLWPAIVTHGVFNTLMIFALYAALASGVPLP